MLSKRHKTTSTLPWRSRSTEQPSPPSSQHSNDPRQSHNSLASRYVPTPSRYFGSRRAASSTASPNSLVSHYVATPPTNSLASNYVATPPTNSLTSHYVATPPSYLSSRGATTHSSTATSLNIGGSPYVATSLNTDASPYVDSPFPNGLAFSYVGTPPRSLHSSSDSTSSTLQEDSSRPDNGFNTTVHALIIGGALWSCQAQETQKI